MNVRDITPADVEALIPMARLMHDESPVFRPYPFHEHVMRGWFYGAIEKPNIFFCALTEKDGVITGGMLACAMPMLFSETRMAAELGLYVYEKYRGSRAGLLLVRHYEAWAKSQNCLTSDTGVLAGINNEVAISFYERMGYEVIGTMMRKELGNG